LISILIALPNSSQGKKKPRTEWRVVLRDSAGAGVHLSWSDALDAAQRDLEQQVRDIGSTVDAFLAGVVLVKIERLPGSEKTAAVALEALPFNALSLTSLKVLRLAGEQGLLSDAVIAVLLQPSLREVDLPGQRLTAERLVSLFGPGGAPSRPRFPELGALRLRRNALGRLPQPVLSQLPALAHLDLSENALESVPGELFQLCPALRSLNLERNARLTVRGLDFRACELRSLLLGLSRLDYIPNLATIASLTDLSLFSLHIQALGPRRDPLEHFEALPVHAEVLRSNAPPLSLFPASKEGCAEVKAALVPLLRSSGSWHALLGALIAKMSGEALYRRLLAQDLAGTGGLHHVLAMIAGPEPVALDACVAVSTLVEHHPSELVQAHAVSLPSAEQARPWRASRSSRPWRPASAWLGACAVCVVLWQLQETTRVFSVSSGCSNERLNGAPQRFALRRSVRCNNSAF
jgi:hypothetical protein